MKSDDTNIFPVLMYHSLSDGRYADARADKYSVSESQFFENVQLLADKGYVVESCKDLMQRLSSSTELPDRYCVMTIDDGHLSNVRMCEILSECGFSATCFVTVDYCRNRKDFLSRTDIKELVSLGMDVGAHGVTHLSLKHMERARMQSEVAESFAWLESVLESKPIAMSLPAGQGDTAVREAAFAAGFQLLADSADRLASLKRTPAVLHRFAVLDGYGPGMYEKLLAGSKAYIVKRRIRSLLLALPKKVLRSYDVRRPSQ